MENRSVQILFEYGIDGRPHSSGEIRLIRPFSYPSLYGKINARASWNFNRITPSKWIIIDRFWHPHDVNFRQVENLINDIRDFGSHFIYAIDDDLLNIPRERFLFQDYHFQIVEYFLQKCDGILVTTPFLKERLASYHKPIFINENSLDDRLLLPKFSFGKKQEGNLKIGYMGSLTHKNDIEIILPALKAIVKRHPNVRIEIIGGTSKSETTGLLSDLPITWISPGPGEDEYALFMLWYTSHVHWDIALAPLENTPFNNAKSDIKLLDYAAVGAAGIFSNVEAYRSTIVPGKLGLLAENSMESWEQALESLIYDEELRSELALNAHQYLYQERILKVCAHKLVSMFESFEQYFQSLGS